MIADELLDGVLYADGFETALIGFLQRVDTDYYIAVYDREKCVSVLMDDGMDEDTAIEYFEFNVSGAYVGDRTPFFVEDYWGVNADD